MRKLLTKSLKYLFNYNKSNFVSVNIFDIIVTFIASTSIIGVILVMLKLFSPLYVLLISFTIMVFIFGIFRFKVILNFPQFTFIILSILFIALIFRVPPYLYVIGGEDVGVYVNMSRWMEDNGTLFVKDKIREKLKDSTKQTYDEYNKLNTGNTKGLIEEVYLPGLYFHDKADSTYVFQFYPLHPLWMSLFGFVFGSDNRVYSLVFFSLISIFSVYLIAYEISGKRAAGYLAAFFLALNPLHAFFSKYTVSEILSLALATLGFYYLIKFFRFSQKGKISPFYLILSAGLFFSLFFNHISGFLYLPFFYILILLSVILIKHKTVKLLYVWYGITVIAAFLLSAYYGYKYSNPYFYDIYLTTFGNYLGKSWEIKLIVLVFILVIIFIIFLYKNKLITNKFARLAPFISKTPYILYLFILVSFIQAYRLSFTDLPIFSSSILVLISYLSSFGFILFLFAIYYFSKRKDNIITTGLLLFLSITFLMRIVLGPHLNYQFLWARYLLSDLLPYIILAIALYLAYLLEGSRTKKIFAIIFIIVISLNFLYFTAYQFRGREGERAFMALKRLSQGLDKNDLVITDLSIAPINTALMFFFNTNIVTIKNIESPKNTELISELSEDFHSIYILTNLPRYKAANLVKVADYHVDAFEQTKVSIPKKFIEYSEVYNRYYLYKVDSDDFFDVSPLWGDLLNFQQDNMWTNGNGIIKNLDYVIKAEDNYIVLTTGGNNPFKNDQRKLNLKMFINDLELEYAGKKENLYYFEIDDDLKEIKEIEILSSTFVPKEFGMNDDTRKLGIDVLFLNLAEKKK